MVKISEEIIEDLKPFADIINYNRTYEFDDKDPNRKHVIENIPEWPDFDEHNFEELVLWLENVEIFVRWESLTQTATILVLDRFLKPKYSGCGLFAESDLEFQTMLDIKIYLIKKFFKPSIVFSVLSGLLSEPYDAETTEDVLIAFSNKCRALILAVLSFEVPLCLNKTILMVSLLNKIPVEIKRKLLNKKSFPVEWSLSEFFDYVLEEEKKILRSLQELQEVEELEDETALVSSRSETEKSTSLEEIPGIICYCCGEAGHVKARCPFRYTRCRNCNKIGHCMNVCRSNQ